MRLLRVSLGDVLRRSGFAVLSAIVLSGCGHSAAISPGTVPLTGVRGVKPFIRQGSDFYPQWVKLPNAAYYRIGITVGPDGAVWVANGGNRVTRIDYWRTIRTFPLPQQVGVFGIAPGPDGKIWLSDLAGSIDRLNPTTGKITIFPIPSGGKPEHLIAGPDGNMWFTEPDPGGGPNNIGRISMTGVISEFTPLKPPSYLASGPDGDVYFGEVSGGAVGRITPSGVITYKFPGGIGSDTSLAFATGPDGNVYFEFGDPCCGLSLSTITSGFKIVSHAWPGADSTMGPPVAVGPDGNIWIGGRLNNRAVFTIFDVASQKFLTQQPTSPDHTFDFVGGMVTGVDGNIWWPNLKDTEVYVYHAISASPESLVFTAPGQQQTVTASETNYSGPLKAYSTNKSVVTVKNGGAGNTFVVTSVAPGSAFVRIDDGHYNNLGVPAAVQ